MKHILARGGGYLGNIARVLVGTALAQLIMVCALPLLSRMYSVPDFGLLGVYVALANICRVLFCLRYDFAIQSATDDDDSACLFWACILSVFSFTLASVAVVYFFGSLHSDLASFKYLIPLMLMISSIDNILGVWLNKNRQFSFFARSRVIRAISVVLLQVVMWVVCREPRGLIFGLMLGELITVLYVGAMIISKGIAPNWNGIVTLHEKVRQYKANPVYLLPGNLINIVVAQLPIFFVSSVFGAQAAGYIYMAQRIVSLPGQLISNAIFRVFFSEATAEYKKNGHFHTLTISTLRFVVPVISLIFIGIGIVSYYLLPSLLGNDWEEAKLIVVVYAMSEVIPAILFSISATWFVTRNEKLNLKYQLVRAAIVVFALFVGVATEQLLLLVMIYGFARTLSYSIFLRKCIQLSKGDS